MGGSDGKQRGKAVGQLRFIDSTRGWIAIERLSVPVYGARIKIARFFCTIGSPSQGSTIITALISARQPGDSRRFPLADRIAGS
jgi:hypothetical protein